MKYFEDFSPSEQRELLEIDAWMIKENRHPEIRYFATTPAFSWVSNDYWQWGLPPLVMARLKWRNGSPGPYLTKWEAYNAIRGIWRDAHLTDLDLALSDLPAEERTYYQTYLREHQRWQDVLPYGRSK